MKILAHVSWLYATLIIFTALTLSILLYPIVPRPYARKISSWLIRITTFYSVMIEGKEDPNVQMFMLNHQSDLDIGIMETSSSKDLAWVAKKALFDVPFFGLALKLPQDIAIERESKTSLITLLRAAKDRLDKGRVITIFPEGTRSTNGKILPFKAGAKVIADKYHLRVQPVVLMQSAKYYNIKEFFYLPGRIKIIYMDAFTADKEDPNWLNELRIKMQKVYDDELANNPRHR
ncbi:MAG TPA: 1-acyl-sn-glycerol-3-phosphate acyltransferase [Sulfurimonas sp. UBA12504]|nr:MAG: glycerol acyltransferase [Sulfurimonas sp. GWF2_37_8]DAB29828.1 MAG TPA: 1-acyl-sn-glycerol-3-phosphate acyltransferase [Sulfurimonas sp. UBA12504]